MLDASGRWYPDWPGQQPYQDPAYIRAYGQNGFNNQPGQQNGNFQNGNNHNAFQQQQQPTQMMTPPTIRAEIIQVDDETAVDRFPLAAGASQMFMTRAEDKIIIKTMGQDGPMPLVIYDKRPPAPPAPKFDPSEFMRRDEAQKIIAEQVETLLSAALTAQKAPQRKQTQEVE